MVLINLVWYLAQWNSYIRLPNNYLTKEVTQSMKPQSNYIHMQDFNRSHQTHFENLQERIPSRFELFLKYAFKSNLVFIGGVRTRQTPRKARTLHEAAFSLVFTCTKATTSQKMSKQQEITNQPGGFRHNTNTPPGCQFGIHTVKKSS